MPNNPPTIAELEQRCNEYDRRLYSLERLLCQAASHMAKSTDMQTRIAGEEMFACLRKKGGKNHR